MAVIIGRFIMNKILINSFTVFYTWAPIFVVSTKGNNPYILEFVVSNCR